MTFAQRRNRLRARFSERIPVVQRRMTRQSLLTSNRGAGITQMVKRLAKGWKGREINPVGANVPHASRPALEPTQPPIQWAPDLFPVGKAAGAWR